LGFSNNVAQRASIAFCGDLHDVSILQANMVTEAEAIGSKEMDMNLSWLAVPFNLKW